MFVNKSKAAAISTFSLFLTNFIVTTVIGVMAFIYCLIDEGKYNALSFISLAVLVIVSILLMINSIIGLYKSTKENGNNVFKLLAFNVGGFSLYE